MRLDYFGNALSIGDTVAFYDLRYRNFLTGTVIKFTPQKVRVKYVNKGGYDDSYVSVSENFIKKNATI